MGTAVRWTLRSTSCARIFMLAKCNWLVEVRPVRQLCDSCALTRTRPRDADSMRLAAFAEAERPNGG